MDAIDNVFRHASESDRTVAESLRLEFNSSGHPDSLFVSREVYESVERVILDWVDRMDREYPMEYHALVMGPLGGLMFKNVELRLAV
jgi:hypothetical protein